MWEAKAHRGMDGIEGFPKFYGIVNHKPMRSIVLEYLGNTNTFHGWDLHHVFCHQGPQLDKHQVLKVIIINVGQAISFYSIFQRVDDE